MGIEDKIILIAGATSGIGLATARKLAELGAQVNFIARNKKRAEETKKIIENLSNNKECRYYLGDLSDQSSLKELTEEIKRDFNRIDVLINNVGGVFKDFTLSRDGIEMTMATNHFSYFFLTLSLLDLLKNAPAARVVNVSSDSNLKGKIDFESFTQNKNYFILNAYAQSKLANILFTKYLSKLLAGTHITVNCLHPGTVKTSIGKKGTGFLISQAWGLVTKVIGITPEEGAKTSVYLASSPKVEGISGQYFNQCKPGKYNPVADSESLQEKLWVESLRMTALDNLEI